MRAMQLNQIQLTLAQYIYPVLSLSVATILKSVSSIILAQVTEIRLRVKQPLLLVLGTSDIMLDGHGQAVVDFQQAYRCTAEDLARTLQLISKNSLYAFEQELKLGFITIPGGHRVGLAGQAIIGNGEIRALKNISSMNIRIAREIKGCADKILPYIFFNGKYVLSTLIISPPRCGKTTILRDLARQISNGNLNFCGTQVGLVDERSEIAACQSGVPTVDLGQRIDVLDGCPKADGMLMLIRSMAPQVVITDELGRAEDADAVKEALNAGVSVIATVHGRNIAEVRQRPYIGELIEHNYFERYVILSSTPSVGTIEEIIDAKHSTILYSSQKGVTVCG
jgi:stage III sporulation protein AA